MQASDDSRGNASRKDFGWDRLGDYAPRSNDRVVTNSNPGHNDYISGKPDVSSNVDGSFNHGFPLIDRMKTSIVDTGHVPNLRVVADAHMNGGGYVHALIQQNVVPDYQSTLTGAHNENSMLQVFHPQPSADFDISPALDDGTAADKAGGGPELHAVTTQPTARDESPPRATQTAKAT